MKAVMWMGVALFACTACAVDVLTLALPEPGNRAVVCVPAEGLKRQTVSFEVPISDVQQLWTPDMQQPLLERKWWISKPSAPQSSMPCIAYFNLAERNVLFFGADALQWDGLVESKVNQERGVYEVTFTAAAGTGRALKPFNVTLDRRRIPWTEVVGEWRDSLSCSKGSYPDGAWRPVYCSWYAAHAAINADWTERQAAIAADLGFGTFILDDGWSYDEAKRVNPETIRTWYRDTGRWDAFSAKKFPDFRSHRERMRNLGLNYVVWVAPYFLGTRSEQFRQWGYDRRPDVKVVEGNALADIEDRPMMESVSEQLVRLLADSDLDGLKVDFLDYVSPSVAEPHGARTLEYVTDLMDRLRAVRPNGLFEFRQGYATPATASLATQFRAGDVPFEWQANLLRLAQIRLTMGDGIPIHADPIYWSDVETDENVARHFMASMAGVPMLSMDLEKMSSGRRKMVRFWMERYKDRIERFHRSGQWRLFYRNGGLVGLVCTLGDEAFVLVNDTAGSALLWQSVDARNPIVFNLGYEPVTLPSGAVVRPAGAYWGETLAEEKVRRSEDIVIETEKFRLTVGTNACAKSLVVKATGEECLDGREEVPLFAATQKRPFNNEVKLIHQHKRTTYPSNRLRREGDRLIVGFATAAYEAEVKVCATNGYAVFELARLISNRTDERHYRGLTMDVPPVESFRILQLPVRDRRHFGEWLNVSWDDKAAVAVVAAEPLAEVDHERRGGHRLMRVDLEKGRDLIGGKAAIVVGAGREAFLDAMDVFERDLDLPRGVAHRRNPLLKASAFWTADLWPENVDQQIALAKRGGFRMMLIYYPSFLSGDEDYFRFGDYDWNEHYPNGEADVRKVLDKVRAAGITPGFHTLQTYIGLKSRYVTPVADARLSLTRHFTLARPVPQDGDVKELFVHENPLDAPKCEKTRILKFGGELFGYDAYSTEPPYRFVGVKRGLFETRAVLHPAGEIGGVLDVSEYQAQSCYIDQGTDLQDEIAEKIARIYDQGMEFCYFDGSEGVNPPCGINVPYSQYRVVRKFKRPPLFVEGAAKGHFGWHLLAGGNAFDVFTPEEFKAKIADYPLREAPLMQNDFTRVDFGWWKHMRPGECSWRDGSVSIGTQPDMWEYGTSKAAAWDCPTAIQFRPDFVEHPRANDLLEVMRRWEDVRATGWLTAAQKETLKSPSREFHLYLNERGEYELCEIEMLPTPEGAKTIRAFLFEREGKRVIAYWHMTGSGTLEVVLGADRRKTAVPADHIRYLTTDLPKAAVKSAWQAAKLVVEK